MTGIATASATALTDDAIDIDAVAAELAATDFLRRASGEGLSILEYFCMYGFNEVAIAREMRKEYGQGFKPQEVGSRLRHSLNRLPFPPDTPERQQIEALGKAFGKLASKDAVGSALVPFDDDRLMAAAIAVSELQESDRERLHVIVLAPGRRSTDMVADLASKVGITDIQGDPFGNLEKAYHEYARLNGPSTPKETQAPSTPSVDQAFIDRIANALSGLRPKVRAIVKRVGEGATDSEIDDENAVLGGSTANCLKNIVYPHLKLQGNPPSGLRQEKDWKREALKRGCKSFWPELQEHVPETEAAVADVAPPTPSAPSTEPVEEEVRLVETPEPSAEPRPEVLEPVDEQAPPEPIAPEPELAETPELEREAAAIEEPVSEESPASAPEVLEDAEPEAVVAERTAEVETIDLATETLAVEATAPLQDSAKEVAVRKSRRKLSTKAAYYAAIAERIPGLTDNRLSVSSLIAQGLLQHEVATELEKDPDTVGMTMSAIYKSVGIDKPPPWLANPGRGWKREVFIKAYAVYQQMAGRESLEEAEYYTAIVERIPFLTKFRLEVLDLLDQDWKDLQIADKLEKDERSIESAVCGACDFVGIVEPKPAHVVGTKWGWRRRALLKAYRLYRPKADERTSLSSDESYITGVARRMPDLTEQQLKYADGLGRNLDYDEIGKEYNVPLTTINNAVSRMYKIVGITGDNPPDELKIPQHGWKKRVFAMAYRLYRGGMPDAPPPPEATEGAEAPVLELPPPQVEEPRVAWADANPPPPRPVEAVQGRFVPLSVRLADMSSEEIADLGDSLLSDLTQVFNALSKKARHKAKG